MPEVCPANTVDEHAARVVAGSVVLLAIASLWPPAMWLSALLAADFFVRAWVNRRFSPLRAVAKWLLRTGGVGPKHVYAPPKQFAARVGSVITIVALSLHAAGLHPAAIGVTAALVVAASLEALLGFCLACWLYPLVHRVASVRA